MLLGDGVAIEIGNLAVHIVKVGREGEIGGGQFFGNNGLALNVALDRRKRGIFRQIVGRLNKCRKREDQEYRQSKKHSHRYISLGEVSSKLRRLRVQCSLKKAAQRLEPASGRLTAGKTGNLKY